MTTSRFETLLFDVDDAGIATLTINRPDKLNALNAGVLEDLQEAVRQIRDQDEIKAAIITGSGDKAFVAGADIKELNTLSKTTGEKLSRKGQSIFKLIETSGKPIAAIVNGYALGGGAELAMACHIRIATPNAVFGLPEVSLGIIPGYGGTQRLPQLIGKSKAMELILTGGQVKAEEAKILGLVNEVTSAEKALEYVKKLIGRMLKNGPLALAKAIEAVNDAYRQDGYATEAACFGDLCETKDFKEGTAAFLEKRKAEFKGE
ncbi:MAG: enoyl-CoA hydratase-related protein [Balneolaceae bacterium]